MIINMNGAKAPETPSPVLQEKTVTPETLPTVIGADEGYDGLSQVTVNPDAQLKAENIRSGKTIFGVEGSFVGEPQPMADPEAQFWMDLATTNSPHTPANAPAGLIQHPFREYAFYNKYIGPEGLDLSLVGLPPSSWNGLTQCMQYFVDGNGKYQLGGDIVLPEGTDGYGQCTGAYLKDVPVGLLNYTRAFVDAKLYIEKLVVKPENIPNNIANGFERMQSFYFEDNAVKYRGLTLELPATVTSVETISGGYGATKMRLVMKATVPPTLSAAYKISKNTLSAIVVPVGSLEAYQTATNWSNSADIMEEGTE